MSPLYPPHWSSVDQLTPPPGSPQLDWLLDPQSLTRRLTALAAGDFAVRPLQQGWQTLRADECQALALAPDSQGWVREVYLCGHDQPWIFARSVAARASLESSGFDLARLGSRSLGELLFSDHGLPRGPIEMCRFPAALLPPAVRAEDLWGRRSCFRRGDLAILVAEVYLPTLWQASQPPRQSAG